MNLEIMASSLKEHISVLDKMADMGILEEKDLRNLLKSDTIEEDVLEAVKKIMAKIKLNDLREKVREVHPHKITPPSPGAAKPRYRTHVDIVDTETGKRSRKEIAKTKEEDLLAWLYAYYTGQEAKDVVKEVPTLASLYPDWIHRKQIKTSQNNAKRIDKTWRRFYVAAQIANKDIRTISIIDIDTWVHDMIHEYQMDIKQYQNFVLPLREILDFAYVSELIQENPFERFRLSKQALLKKPDPEPEEEVFSVEEEKALFDMAWKDYKENRRLIYPLGSLAVPFQFFTGTRVGELCALKYSDLCSDGTIKIQRMVIDQDKIKEFPKSDAGVRKIHLTQQALDIIAESRRYHERIGQESCEFIFGNSSHLKPRIIVDRYESFCKKLDIMHRPSHKNRKTAVTAYIEGGATPDEARRFAGHADVKTTLKYYVRDRQAEKQRNAKIDRALLV